MKKMTPNELLKYYVSGAIERGEAEAIAGIEILKRTFEAAKHPKNSQERVRLNCDPLTSEYSTGSPWLARFPALMSDGTPNPAQRWHNAGFKTKNDAAAYLKLKALP